MEHGVHIPAKKRDTIAREAVRIFDAAQTRIEGLFDVEIRFDVSTPTARNLVNRGRYLRDNKEGPPMTDKEFLEWVIERLIHVYGESPNVDFVLRLKHIAAKQKQ